ncbi:hypothetical protein, partial [Streptomyces panaciradicis]|uniref:hypothetical protein n=1 Tax=Streptomyces panaciradicis TaxID=1470261 RepID=UPI00201CF45F
MRLWAGRGAASGDAALRHCLRQEQLLDVLVVGGGEQLLGRLDELDVVELDVLHRDSLPFFFFPGLFPATD